LNTREDAGDRRCSCGYVSRARRRSDRTGSFNQHVRALGHEETRSGPVGPSGGFARDGLDRIELW
jgi:hypothetical protein